MITFWTCALALTCLYVVLDGFDLGVGMLFAFAPNETARRHILAANSPVWDGNETWLVLTAAILFGAFPLVYATLLSAFYLPIIIMLAALILRGVAFEFRYKSRGRPLLWDIGFVGGSFVASFIQGTAVGALVEGLAVRNDLYVGGGVWLAVAVLVAVRIGTLPGLFDAGRRMAYLQNRRRCSKPGLSIVTGDRDRCPEFHRCCIRLSAGAQSGSDASVVRRA
jgi:cytochrome d oxidase subunit CydB